MLRTLRILQLIVALVLTGLVLVQAKEGGLSSVVNTGTMYRSRRGLEKIIFVGTIALGIIFSLNSLFILYLS